MINREKSDQNEKSIGKITNKNPHELSLQYKMLIYPLRHKRTQEEQASCINIYYENKTQKLIDPLVVS